MCFLWVSTPVWAAESSLSTEGNVAVTEEEINNMKADYQYLENEIQSLFPDSNIESENLGQIKKRKDAIQSKGRISFEEGVVLINANDLLYLADEIDLLESTYKCNLVDALGSIGTYFKTDGTVTYDKNQQEVNTTELKTMLSIGNIIQGIQISQSVAYMKDFQATDKRGNPLYYNGESANENKEYLNNTTIDNGYPIYYKEAEADNLSAGCAAWVNGILLKGNGEDNKRSRQEGYNEGYSQGVADSLGKANIVYSYHKHIGNNSTTGGCYGMLTGVKYRKCGCSTYAYKDDYPGFEGRPLCAYCFHPHPGVVCNMELAVGTETYIGLICQKTEQTIESATIVY